MGATVIGWVAATMISGPMPKKRTPVSSVRGYRARRLYAHAPNYDAGYAAATDAPGYDVAVTTDRYYAPAWNVAYAGPYYDYAPGVSFGIGIGSVGIGFGPAWGW